MKKSLILSIITLMFISMCSLPVFADKSAEVENLLFVADTCVYQGEIMEINDNDGRKSILVQKEEESDYTYQSLIFHINEDTRINTNDFSDLEKGQIVEIYYSGMVTRSLPGQTTAIAINILDQQKHLQNIMFKGEIEEVYNNDEHFSFLLDGQSFGKEKVYSEKIIFHVDEKTIINNAKLADLKSGSKVTVTCSPAMTMSLPPQSYAVRIDFNTGDVFPEDTAIKVLVNDKYLDISLAPYIKNGQVMLPLRNITETLGGNILWNETDRSVNIKQEGNDVKLFINQKTAHINGNVIELKEAPEIMSGTGRTMVSFNTIAAVFGNIINWEDSSNTVILNSKE